MSAIGVCFCNLDRTPFYHNGIDPWTFRHGAFIPIGKATPLGQDRTISALQEILVAALPPPRKPKAKKMPVNDSSSIVA